MIKTLKYLIVARWKVFIRSKNFEQKFFTEFWGWIFGSFIIFSILIYGFSTFWIIRSISADNPLFTFNRWVIVAILYWFFFRHLAERTMNQNIKPWLLLPIKKKLLAHSLLTLSFFSSINLGHYFFFVPFCITLYLNGYDGINVLLYFMSLACINHCFGFLNHILLYKKKWFIAILLFVALLFVSYIYDFYDVTLDTQHFFQFLYDKKIAFVVLMMITIGVYFQAHRYILNQLQLDVGNKKKKRKINIDISWLKVLNKNFVFVENDFRLLFRNKVTRSILYSVFFWIFYGLLLTFFPDDLRGYSIYFKIFIGIYSTGSFLMMFGQYVPSWDSSYYPLMMSQNVVYKQYLNAKWLMNVSVTLIITIFTFFYFWIDKELFLIILVCSIYNMGINSYLTLWSGVYNRSPMRLDSGFKALTHKSSYNLKTTLLGIAMIAIPVMFYSLGIIFFNHYVGMVAIALFGLIGFVLKNWTIELICKIYKKQKYLMLDSFKEK